MFLKMMQHIPKIDEIGCFSTGVVTADERTDVTAHSLYVEADAHMISVVSNAIIKVNSKAVGSNFSVVRPNSYKAVYREFRVISGH